MSQVVVRKACIQDVKAIHKLLFDCAKQGLLLARSFNQLYHNVRDFHVAEQDGEILACSALSICWEDLAEIRSLVVADSERGKGYGRAVVASCLEEAASLGLGRIFALTYVPDFFGKFGFGVVQKDVLPHKVWGDCLNCPKFPECDETAVLLEMAKNPDAIVCGEEVAP